MSKDGRRKLLIPCEHLEHAGEILARITLYALDDDRYRARWEASVRAYADKLCAGIAALRMSGASEADIPAFDVEYPVPKGIGIDPACVYTAFCLAVSGEVARRMEVIMGAGPGAPG